ncbi:MAG: ATP-binding cassette domain-containing protein [Pseudonocardia sp.]|nr:ATP-binding cassette domain-containing protein [Pseudonocardia sp.]
MPPKTEVIPPEVVIDNVTAIIGESAVLHRLTLVVPAGQVTVLMGPSGVGKTTLIKHVVGLLEPSGGTVRIGGQDIWEMSKEELREVRKGMGAMLGGHNLYSTSVFSSLSVLDNLLYTLESLGVPESERRHRAMARLSELRLMDDLERKPEELPAHAIKRLALARALVADAPLTVLDEIDVGMDAEHSAAMVNAVRGLRARTGCTLLLTTHNLGLARSVADNLAIMVNGRIVAFGPPGEVLDGIQSTEDFDRRFEFSDYVGPPRLEDVEAAAVRKRPKTRKVYHLTIVPQMVIIAVIALILITAVFLAARVFASGTLLLF